jgi:hypothetical protein
MKKCGEIWKIFLKKMDESELGVEIMNYSKVSFKLNQHANTKTIPN